MDGIPDVQHGIDHRVGRVDGEPPEVLVPVLAQIRERRDHVVGFAEARHLRGNAGRP